MYLNPMTDIREMTLEQVDRFSATWWSILIIGLLSLAAGVIILGSTWTLASIAVFIGVLLIVRGIFQTASSTGFGIDSQSWNLFVGILSIIVGFAIFVIPLQTLLFVATFVGVWLVVTGLFDLVGSLAVRNIFPFWWLVLIRGIVAVPLGIWALGRPFQTLALLVYVLGIWAIVIGVLEIVMAFEVRRLPSVLAGVMRPQLGTT